ncbi:MAG TPA: PCRF domain-containing protein, partial [Deltaproteobacteria bacterium]|nr:PCRF domain-containing protein [Deltaproteobacteria bacterium]
MKELDALAVKEDFWNDPDRARRVLQEKSRLEEAVDSWRSMDAKINELSDL